jgi:ribose/xylose/arabinose/galactoside ABC-type transport system permease subunit
MSVANSGFLDSFNLTNLLRNIAIIGVVGVGMTVLFVAGEIDLSVGSLLGFLIVLFGILVVRLGIHPAFALVAVVAAGTILGSAAGLIRTILWIPSFIVTLALMAIYRSLALIIAGGYPIAVEGVGPFYTLTGGYVFGLPWLVVWMFAVAGLGTVILSATRFGYHAYATGGNYYAARDVGIDVSRIKVESFAFTGALTGLAAAWLFGYLLVGAPTTGEGFEFRVIGAVVVGGAALTGGRGSVPGTILGALIIGIIASGLSLYGFSQGAADIASGALIVFVATLNEILSGNLGALAGPFAQITHRASK